MFLQRPKPYSDESLESFFIRVANKNGYDDVHRFLVATKQYLQSIDHSGFQTFPSDISKINPASAKSSSRSRNSALLKLSQMTYNEPTDLTSLAINRTHLKYSPATSALIRGSEVVPRSLLRKGSIPCCPLCLAEHGYASYLWHFEGYDYCHIHYLPLTRTCNCGADYDYRVSGLNGLCKECDAPLSSNASEMDKGIPSSVSNWLAGEQCEVLPALPKSYRWGLVHWWNTINDDEFNPTSFFEFFSTWPNSLYSLIKKEIEFNLEHAVVSRNELRLNDVLGRLFFSSIRLPERSLRYNIILRELLSYIDQNLWLNSGLLANLRMNALQVAIFMNCSVDEVASMVEQRIVTPNRRVKPNTPIEKTEHLFHLGDIYCLWLAEFQTDEFNRSFYVSRW
ncbi:TniQ family protein [Agarivorans sp. QJM3NY_33]|uniref:TniQ family protein n=1 Tax=Agarivorans sp. QJM3NY_33 TaxID=3421432 RepID=UPI003D7DB934